MRMTSQSHRGFTLVEIMIVVAIIGLIAAIAVPNFVKARELSQKSACIENLRQIFTAKTAWYLEQNKGQNDIPGNADLFGVTQYIRQTPECPSGGTYDWQAVNRPPTCTEPGHELLQ
jgi:prepilin-type N-terminal cleavage/methylation domain-containing protein